MKNKTLKELESLLNPELNISADLDKSDRFFATLITPQNFVGNDNFEVIYEKEFESNCIKLSEYTKQPVKTLTVKEYFSLLEYHNNKNKPQPMRK